MHLSIPMKPNQDPPTAARRPPARVRAPFPALLAPVIALMTDAPTDLVGAEASEPAARAARVVQEIRWDALSGSGALSGGELDDAVAPPDDAAGKGVLRVSGTGTLPVAVLTSPGTTLPTHALRGWIRFENVGVESHLEMWTVYAEGERYFTRTLSGFGPMASFTGAGGWRPIVLPFQSLPDHPAPEALELNVVLPKGGTVWLAGFELLEADALDLLLTVPGAWWGDATAGWIGAMAGTAIGMGSALLAVVMALGVAPRFTRLVLALASVVAVAVLATGGIALLKAQPYAVWYPLVLIGGLSSVVFPVMLGVSRRLQTARELRQIQALDGATG